MKGIPASDTYTLKTELVLPNDTNTLGNLMGGKLLHWMDVISAIAAQPGNAIRQDRTQVLWARRLCL